MPRTGSFQKPKPRRAVTWCLTVALIAPCCFAAACNDADPEPPAPLAEPVFPEDLSDWQEGRPCAFSHEHDLRYIRVVTDEAARIPYQALDARYPYPTGATLVKLEYDDENCRKLLGYTAMQKLAVDDGPKGSDWRWQRVDRKRKVTEDGLLRTCVNCHEYHCTWPICGYEGCGFDLTCGQELPR